ncbi:MAG TPA: S8 family serine peptidase [Candidatus Obscuribacterales bacterium]
MALLFKRMTALLCAATSLMGTISAASAFELKVPTHIKRARSIPAAEYTPDVLLVMPGAKQKDADILSTVTDAHGKVLGALGEGDLRVYVIKTEKGKLEQTERKFFADKKHFSVVCRNYSCPRLTTVPTDYGGTAQWHHGALRSPLAWDIATGAGTKIAIFDTGCEADNPELAGKTDRGFDAHAVASQILLGVGGGGLMGGILGGALSGLTSRTPLGAVGAAGSAILADDASTTLAGAVAGAVGGSANDDKHGHGTRMAVVAAGNWNNPNAGPRMSLNSCGIAPNARIYPVRIAEETYGIDAQAKASDLDLIAAMIHMMAKPDIRIINISYGAPYVGFANPQFHPALHKYFQDYAVKRSGLIFMSAGNYAVPDPTPRVPYLFVVNGIDEEGELGSFGNGKGSAWGEFVSFTAPSTNIACSSIQGDPQPSTGTSPACALVSGMAALILDKKPALPNFEVIRILIRSCKNIKGYGFSPFYGWGMPDAYLAAGIASGKSKEQLEREALNKLDPNAAPGTAAPGSVGSSPPSRAVAGGVVPPSGVARKGGSLVVGAGVGRP